MVQRQFGGCDAVDPVEIRPIGRRGRANAALPESVSREERRRFHSAVASLGQDDHVALRGTNVHQRVSQFLLRLPSAVSVRSASDGTRCSGAIYRPSASSGDGYLISVFLFFSLWSTDSAEIAAGFGHCGYKYPDSAIYFPFDPPTSSSTCRLTHYSARSPTDYQLKWNKISKPFFFW